MKFYKKKKMKRKQNNHGIKYWSQILKKTFFIIHIFFFYGKIQNLVKQSLNEFHGLVCQPEMALSNYKKSVKESFNNGHKLAF